MSRPETSLCLCGSGKKYRKCHGVNDRFPHEFYAKTLFLRIEEERELIARHKTDSIEDRLYRDSMLFALHSLLWKMNDFGGMSNWSGLISLAAIQNVENPAIPQKKSYVCDHRIPRMVFTRHMMGLTPKNDINPVEPGMPAYEKFLALFKGAAQFHLLTNDENLRMKKVQKGIDWDLKPEVYLAHGVELVQRSHEWLRTCLRQKRVLKRHD